MSNRWISTAPKPNPATFEEYVKDEYLASLIEGKRIAIVGPGTKVQNAGEFIDSFDVVIRVSQIFPLSPAQYKDRGSRTDIILHSFNHLQINEALKHMNHLKSVKYIICSMVGAKLELLTNKGIKIHQPSDGYLYKNFYEVGTTLNSGISGIMLLLEYDIKELYVTGFDFYNMGQYGNVYFNDYYEVTTRSKAMKKVPNQQMTPQTGRRDLHNPEQQILYFRELAKRKSDVIKLDDYLTNNL